MDTVTRMTGVQKSGILSDGVEDIVPMGNVIYPCTVYINPEVGDTVSYYYSLDGGVSYVLQGTATAYTEEKLVGSVTHLKFQRTAGSGTTSSYGVV